jgi:alanyl-tRNA synthetase
MDSECRYCKYIAVMTKAEPSELIINAKTIFDLHTSQGLGLGIIEAVLHKNGCVYDKEGYQELIRRHKSVSRQSADKKFSKDFI